MTIIRAPRPETGFTPIDNRLLRDGRLSYRARGVLAAILSRPDNWRTTSDTLALEGREGREAMRTAMRELMDAGYVIVQRVRAENGQISTVTTVYDVPQKAPTGDGFSEAGFPEVGLPGLFIKTIKKDYKEVELPPIVPRDSFDEFWTIYPRKEGKTPARRAWDKAVKKISVDEILQGARRYESDPNRQPMFTLYAATWLNQERWDDPPLPGRSTKTSATATYLEAAEMFSDADLREIGS